MQTRKLAWPDWPTFLTDQHKFESPLIRFRDTCRFHVSVLLSTFSVHATTRLQLKRSLLVAACSVFAHLFCRALRRQRFDIELGTDVQVNA